MEKSRSTQEIVLDLEQLCQEEGYIYTFSFIVFCALVTTPEMALKIDWTERPNHQELSFLLGLMVKSPLSVAHPPTDEVFSDQNQRTYNLLRELQKSHIYGLTNPLNDSHPTIEEPIEGARDGLQEWMTSGQGMVEPIFYGGEGAYFSQYLEMAHMRYQQDRDWLERCAELSIDSAIEVARELEQWMRRGFAQIHPFTSFEESYQQFLDILCFEPKDFPELTEESMERFLRAFSLAPGTANQCFNSIGDYNKVHSHPVVILQNGKYFIPILINLARSIYESPFYWMLQDEEYKETAFENRGDATERIIFDLVSKVFGKRNTFRNVRLEKDGNDVTDIDILGVCGNKAIIIQAKSKKLTVESRLGDGKSLEKDFQSAIQAAYEQALRSRRALLEDSYTINSEDASLTALCRNLDEAYIVCVTGDHYPALAVQVKNYLHKEDSDPFPLAVSVFNLELLTHYLNDPFDFSYYVRQRTRYAEHIWSISELALVGFHLALKLAPRPQAGLIVVSESFAQPIEVDFLIAKGQLPESKSITKLSYKWRDKVFNDVLLCIKRANDNAVTDAIFFLFDLAGERFREFTNRMQQLRLATAKRGKPLEIFMPKSEAGGGVYFGSYPAPLSRLEAEVNFRNFEVRAGTRKYQSKADEWLALGSFEGSSDLIDMSWYSRDPWQFDSELDSLTQETFGSGRAITHTDKQLQHKPSRNQPCPCGSTRKFKRCHGR